MDTKKLRQKILDLAIRGKLVPQDPNDEPASVLLARIRAEKERLIAEGKIKRPKKSKTSSAESQYQNFDLPNTWEIVRLDEVCDIKGGKRIPSGSSFSDIPTPHIYLRVTDMKENTILDNDLKFIDESIYVVIKNYTISKDDLYLTIAGTIGCVGIIPEKFDGMNLTENAAKLTNITVDKEYLMYALLATSSQEHFSSKFHQVAQPKLSIETASSTPIPIPPYPEQLRIVQYIKNAVRSLEDLEKMIQGLGEDVRWIKSKILDLAMQGKLLPQDPTDEPAAYMLHRVNPKAEIITDNPHYANVPITWIITNINSVCDYGKSQSVFVEDIEDNHWVLELEDIEKGTGKLLCRRTKSDRQISGIRHKFHTDDVLYSKLRTYLNKVLLADCDGFATTEIIPIKPFECVSSDYLCLWLRSPYFVSYTVACGYGVKMPRLSTSDAKNGIIPLPPINEQKRIVAKIEELYSILDEIEKSLTD